MTTPADIFANLSDTVDKSKLDGLNMTVVFELSGDDGGAWTLNVADGDLNVSEGADDGASATIKMDAEDYVKMASGDLNAMMAFMSGKIKVEGDLNSVMKLQSIIG